MKTHVNSLKTNLNKLGDALKGGKKGNGIEKYAKKITDALRKERENLDLTQKEMVEGTSISVSHYSKIENDIQDIKAKDLFELLDARKIDVSYIDAISSIVYKDNISKAYSGQPVNLKVTFEAKQADNISWSSIDSYQLSGTNA